MSRKKSKNQVKSPQSPPSPAREVKTRHRKKGSNANEIHPVPSTSAGISHSSPDSSSTDSPSPSLSPTQPLLKSSSKSLTQPVLRLKKKSPSKDSLSWRKSSSFVDVSGVEVSEGVTQSTKRNASKELHAFKIFSIEDSVQMFFIDSSGVIHTEEDTWTLYIVRLSKRSGHETAVDETETQSTIQPAAFMHVGNWLYPLYPGCSPVLITAFGTYIFPDLRQNKAGSSVALVLPQHLSLDDREKFEILLDYYASVEDSVNRLAPNELSYFPDLRYTQQPHLHLNPNDLVSLERYEHCGEHSSFLRHPIIRSSWWWEAAEDEIPLEPRKKPSTTVVRLKHLFKAIVWFITLIVQLFEWIIRYLARLIRQRGRRASHHHLVDENILQGVLYAKSATSRGVILTSVVVNSLHQEAMNLSKLLAPSLSALVPRSLEHTAIGNALKSTVEVGATTFGGVSDVYKVLTGASTLLMDAFCEETIKTMEYRYGEQYGSLTKEAFDAALNVREALTNTGKITSLAFVPNTIDTRIKERVIDTPDARDSEEEQLEEKRTSEVTRERTIAEKSCSKRAGRLESKDQPSNQDKHSIARQVRQDSYKSDWAWLPPNLADQVNLEGKIRDTETETNVSEQTEIVSEESSPDLKPLESQQVTKEETQKMSEENSSDLTTFDKQQVTVEETQNMSEESSSVFKPLDKQQVPIEETEASVSMGHFNPRSRKSAEDIALQDPSAPSVSRANSYRQSLVSNSTSFNLSRSSSTHIRSRASIIELARRESLYMSQKRQSMHVTAEMARMIEQQLTELPATPELALCCRGSQDNLFREAAISITRAKIRRLHRERAAERFLVVVKLGTSILRNATNT